MIQRILSAFLILSFVLTSLPLPSAQAQALPQMPQPGTLVRLSPQFTPAHLSGITINSNNALQFDFLIHKGDEEIAQEAKSEEYKNLIKYFLASLTIADENQWVNLSPYEKERIIEEDFGKTEMGRDLLAQDYLLKQITSSLMYPEDQLGKSFWDKVYAQAKEQFGSASVPMNTFNKVWIVPHEAVLLEKDNTAYIIKSRLKVMMEEDYLALKHNAIKTPNVNDTSTVTSKIVREIILPELEKEVNEGKNFAKLRQIYSGMILATWYKKALKESLLGQVYADQSKVAGINQPACRQAGTLCEANEAIYKKYLEAFRKGAFNYIKEDVDKYTNEIIPRKYFSGGFQKSGLDRAMVTLSSAEALQERADDVKVMQRIVEKGQFVKVTAELNTGTDVKEVSTTFAVDTLNKETIIRYGSYLNVEFEKDPMSEEQPIVDGLFKLLDALTKDSYEGSLMTVRGPLTSAQREDVLTALESTQGFSLKRLNDIVRESAEKNREFDRGLYEPLAVTLESLARVSGDDRGMLSVVIENAELMSRINFKDFKGKDIRILERVLHSIERFLRERTGHEIGDFSADRINLPSNKEGKTRLELLADLINNEVPGFFFFLTKDTGETAKQEMDAVIKNALNNMENPSDAQRELLQERLRAIYSRINDGRDIFEEAKNGPVEYRTVATYFAVPSIGFLESLIERGLHENPGVVTGNAAMASVYFANEQLNELINLDQFTQPQDKQILTLIISELLRGMSNEELSEFNLMPKVVYNVEDFKLRLRNVEKLADRVNARLTSVIYVPIGLANERIEKIVNANGDSRVQAPRIDQRLARMNDRVQRTLVKGEYQIPLIMTKGEPSYEFIDAVMTRYFQTKGAPEETLDGVMNDQKVREKLEVGLTLKQQIQLWMKRSSKSVVDRVVFLARKAQLMSVMLAVGSTLTLSVPSNAQDINQPTASMDEVGGIDLNAANLNMVIKRDGKGVPLPLAQQDLEALRNIPGFIPVIINITPVTSLPILSALEQVAPAAT